MRKHGRVFGYESENERLWYREGEELVLVSRHGRNSSRYRMLGDGEVWFGRHERRVYPMYLIPVLSYTPHENAQHLPPVVINAIPKAGTHLCEAILTELGFESGATMFSWENLVDDFQHEDYLEIEDEEGSRGKICPLDVAIGAIPNGTMVLSHATIGDWIERSLDLGVHHIHCIRNLRDVLISLYRWKMRGVQEELTLADFLSFLEADQSADVALVAKTAQNILAHGLERAVRYEDLTSTNADSTGTRVLARSLGLPENEVAAALACAVNRNTTTYNPIHSDHSQFWSNDLELFFNSSGLADINHALGFQ